ncbi:MAG: hypothetical protein LJE93_09560 [Acidobacteria bacterium]|jgi:hypothetical protein|nr:hypothetical protein [Acidobacteriota bacterium]
MGLLGQMLIERGAISVEQLQTGLEACREGGERLGTCLVDQGFIDERSLLEALAEQQGVPFISAGTLLDFLESLDSGVLPRAMLEQLQVVPFRKVNGRLQVAMSNPADPKIINRIASFTQLQVEPFVASDRTIELALKRAKEFVPVAVDSDADLLTDVVADTESFGWDDLWRPHVKPATLLELYSRPQAAGTVLTASFPSLIPVGSGEGRVRGAKIGSTELFRQLGSASSAAELGEKLTHYASQRLDRICLFAVHHGKVSGWMGRGLPLDAPDLRSFSTLSEIPSVFWELEEIDRYVGPLQGGPVDAQVLEILGLPAPVEVLVVPLKMKGRTKGYLLGDIPGQPVPESVIDEMVAASRVAGDALTAILRGKS